MPTYNRRAFIPHAIKYFLRQDYTNKELIILDDGSDSVQDLIPENPLISYKFIPEKITLGEKLNMATEMSAGNIVLQWDDDDWYAENRISYQVKNLLDSAKSVCGINQLYYYNLESKEAFKYTYPRNLKPWLLGSSLCFKKELWENHKFVHTNIGMDGRFVWGVSPEQIGVLEDYSFAVHMIHKSNISPKRTNGDWWQHYPMDEIAKIMGKDWELYRNISTNGSAPVKAITLKSDVDRKQKIEPSKPVRNIFACLVHEKKECIADMVQNLHYQDPESEILLYNGGNDHGLLKNDSFPYHDLKAHHHPAPTRQKHGYLHGFAMDCMKYALKNHSFDTLTIVDSDQLLIRKGYSKFLGAELQKAGDNIGLLSSDSSRILPENKTNHIAQQAHKEFPLWRPFLQKFPNGEDQFVHWTFWPSTVFTYNAIADLVELFQKDRELDHIISRSGIWAMEEILFPTLVKLLGYQVINNPCSHDYVHYRKKYNVSDLRKAKKKSNVYFMHPVPRKYDEQIRKSIRDMHNGYTNEKTPHPVHAAAKPEINKDYFSFSGLQRKIKAIQGWLSEAEAELLSIATLKACIELESIASIVEVGSFKGKSTVLIGKILNEFKPKTKIYAIDPHNGVVGAEGQNIENLPPTLQAFNENIEKEGLKENVRLIREYSYNVAWNDPISLLFVDGLHDYSNVSRDFGHFERFISPGAFVAFHDYAEYYPDVVKFVDELLDEGKYTKIHLVDSLIVLKKRAVN